MRMAPRAYWKGYLKLSLVSCPVALYPATGEREKVRFHRLNGKTGHRIRYRKVDEETGREVDSEQIIKGYEVGKGQYIEVTDDELEAVALDSTRTIDIVEFVPKNELDPLYNIRPYYIAPDGKAGQEAYVTIREAIADTGKVAIGRLVLTTREHMIAVEPRGKGLMGTLLRYPYEVRDEADYFDDIPNVRVDKEALELAKHIVQTKTGHFKPGRFEDRYESALRELIAKKQKGEKIEAPKPERRSNVLSLMDALRRSVETERRPSRRRAAAHPRRASSRRAHARRKAG
jgi:DNA end-binding protein Ku